jgi:hypothetical protein
MIAAYPYNFRYDCCHCTDVTLLAQHCRCTWETTCPTTGMPNAYVVSAVTRRPLTSATPDSNDDTGGSPQNNNSRTMQWGGGATSVYTLANGEQRRRTELPDRCKRLDILARHGLLNNSATSPHKSKRAGTGTGTAAAAGGAYADDAFENSDDGESQQHDDDYGSDEFEGRSPSPQKRNNNRQNNSHHGGDDAEGAGAAGKFQQCAAVGWSMVKRQVSNGS